MKKSALCISASFILFVHQAHASWDVSGTVDYLEIGSEVRIMVGPMNINPGGCAATGEYALPSSATNFKEIYSALVAARIAGKTVSVDLSGCSTSTYNKVIAIRFED